MPNLKLIKIKSEIALRKMGTKFGVDVKMTDEEILVKQLIHNEIDMIFDIGANTGQFGEMIYKLGYEGKMISFEPLQSAYEILQKKCKKNAKWDAAEKCAIGEKDGEIEMHISGNSISSSVLNILSEHTQAVPDSEFIGTEISKVYKLDTVFEKYSADAKNILLKIDTQGYEDKVLDGGVQSLKRIKGLFLEMSLVKLYEGQVLFDELYKRIKNYGYELYGIQPAFLNKDTGRVLQVDATFFRS